MLRQSIFILFATFTLSANANADTKDNPMDNFISNQIEELDLQLELFGTQNNDVIVDVSSIHIYEIEEEATFDFDTKNYLPKDFNATEGMEGIDWKAVKLYEVEEEVDLGFETKDYLPKDFNPYQGMVTVKSQGICYF